MTKFQFELEWKVDGKIQVVMFEKAYAGDSIKSGWKRATQDRDAMMADWRNQLGQHPSRGCVKILYNQPAQNLSRDRIKII